MTLEQAVRQALTERTSKAPLLADGQLDIARTVTRRVHRVRWVSTLAVAAAVIAIAVAGTLWLRSPRDPVASPISSAPVIAAQLVGDWNLNEVDVAGGQSATPPREVSLSFSDQGEVNAQLSCNAISSRFSIVDSNRLQTEQPGQSLLACDPLPGNQRAAWLLVDRGTKAIFTDHPVVEVTAKTLTITTAQVTLHYSRTK